MTAVLISTETQEGSVRSQPSMFVKWNKVTVSPVLAALGDPRPHGGVKHLSAHVWVLTVRVEQPSQGSQSVPPVALRSHGLQVLKNGGGQHFSWSREGNRRKWKTFHTIIYFPFFFFLLKSNAVHLCTWLAGITRIIHNVNEFIFRESTCVFIVLKHIVCPTVRWLPYFTGRETKVRKRTKYTVLYICVIVILSKLQHLLLLLSDIVLLSPEARERNYGDGLSCSCMIWNFNKQLHP